MTDHTTEERADERNSSAVDGVDDGDVLGDPSTVGSRSSLPTTSKTIDVTLLGPWDMEVTEARVAVEGDVILMSELLRAVVDELGPESEKKIFPRGRISGSFSVIVDGESFNPREKREIRLPNDEVTLLLLHTFAGG